MRGLMLVATLPLCACMATSPASWQHTQLADSAASERQFVIDNGYCRQVAVGGAPMPPMPAPPQQEPGYDVTAQTTTMGPGGMTHATTRATVTPRPSGGFAGGMAGGLAQGAALRQQIDARRAQSEIYDGCMYRLGWDKRRS